MSSTLPAAAGTAAVAVAAAATGVFVSRDAYRLALRWALGQVATAESDPPALAGAVLAACASLYGQPKLLDLQGALPPLPLPPLEATVGRFLESVRPLLSPVAFWQTEVAAKALLAQGGRGAALQARLEAMRDASMTKDAAAQSWEGVGDRNWLAPLWLDVAYLRGRAPLPVNVSFYSTDQVRLPPKTRCQAARAAGLVLGILEFWDRVETGSLPPFLVGKGAARAPVDMSSYPWLIGTCRVPGATQDRLQLHRVGRHPSQSPKDGRCMGDCHVLVSRGTALFAVPVQRGGRRATFSELRGAMQAVIEQVPHPGSAAATPRFGSAAAAGRELEPRSHGASAVAPEYWSFPDSPPVALLTTWGRSEWAEARDMLGGGDSQGSNALSSECGRSLADCESALVGISLFFEGHERAGAGVCGTDGGSGSLSPAGSPPAAGATPVSEAGNRIARTAFTGNGWSWWCDKAVSVGVFADGRSCWHIEHTPADAPVPSHLIEHAVVVEAALVNAQMGGARATPAPSSHKAASSAAPSGPAATSAQAAPRPPHFYPDLPSAAPLPATSPFACRRLRFPGVGSSAEMQSHFSDAADDFRSLCGSTGLCLMLWEGWGSDAIKKRFQCAPDAFVQAALQAASFRFFGRAVLTYESASTRAFAHGRTETIRSATLEAQALAELLQGEGEGEGEGGAADPGAVLAALRLACEAHRERTRSAMRGAGVDRHMLALRVADAVAAGDDVGAVSPLWRSPGWMLEYELSTSQTPLVQEHWESLTSSDVLALGGGFGPSCAGGVGVSYFIIDRFLYFHVSSSRSADSPAACGAPEVEVGGLRAPAGSPLAHAHAFGRELRLVLGRLQAASSAVNPAAWRDEAGRASRL